MTHTPGPWRWTLSDGAPKLVNADGIRVLDYWTAYTDDEGLDATEVDMTLIAAAPDMLDALQHVAEWCDLIRQNYPEMWNDFKAVKPAIQQATGGA